MQLDNNEFKATERRGLIVWIYSLKQLKNLKEFGLLHYVLGRTKYVVLYLSEGTLEETKKRIRKLHFVQSVECSYRPDIEMDFAEKIGNKTVLRDRGFEIEEPSTEIRLTEYL